MRIMSIGSSCWRLNSSDEARMDMLKEIGDGFSEVAL
jgi:hypothetical protein